MKSLVLLSLAFAAVAAFAAEKSPVLFSGTSSLTVYEKDGDTFLEKIETRFFEEAYEKKMFRFTSKVVSRVDADGAEQSGVIEAFITKATLFDTPAWKINVKGAEFSILNQELVQVNEWGCCDSPTVNRLYNRETGAQVEAALNGTTIEFEVPNSNLNRRYLAAVLDSKAPKKHGSKSYIGTISYFDGQKIKGRVRIYAPLENGWGSQLSETEPVLIKNNDKQDKKVNLWNADGSNDPAVAFSEMGLSGKVSYNTVEDTFKVMVNGDKIDASQTEASGDLEFEIL